VSILPGFKSVFKVADTVHISSTQYTFMFDKRRGPVGMITPIWTDKFPVEEGWTYFRIQLSEDVHLENLRKQLGDIQTCILLFLKKLCMLTIVMDAPPRTLRFSRTVRQSRINTLTTEINGVTESHDYFIVKHMVKTYQAERRRMGIKQSEIVLAFPLREDGVPCDDEQFVCAFLPLRRFGFRVCFTHHLQARVSGKT
jgi:hypothetical protein